MLGFYCWVFLGKSAAQVGFPITATLLSLLVDFYLIYAGIRLQRDRQENKKLKKLLCTTIPYVTSTIGMALDGIGEKDNDEWGNIHKGRASSSIRQLEHILEHSKG